jgi:hypothetical protein
MAAPKPPCAVPSVVGVDLAELFFDRPAARGTVDLADVVPGDQRIEIVLLRLGIEQRLKREEIQALSADPAP